MASRPASMPRLSSIGLAPAVTFFRPSLTMAWASTVAVVVPSPATSLVLVAASLRSWAPMFSNGSFSSISLATVTPSWVTVGLPHFLSRATLRPLGPRVVLTALASGIDAGLERASCLVFVDDLLCHVIFSFEIESVLLTGNPVGRTQCTIAAGQGLMTYSTIARTSLSLRIKYSLPSSLTVVPAYLA